MKQLGSIFLYESRVQSPAIWEDQVLKGIQGVVFR